MLCIPAYVVWAGY